MSARGSFGLGSSLMHHLVRAHALRVAAVLLAVALGIASTTAGYELIAWRSRQAVLLDQANRILDNSAQVAIESRASIAAVARLKTIPCSDRDLAEMRLIVARTAKMVNIGRVADGVVLCDSASGSEPRFSLLRKPDLVSPNGSKVWLNTPLYGDWRMMTTAASRDGVIVFVRPTDPRYQFAALGKAVATFSSAGSQKLVIRSNRSDLVGAAYADRSEEQHWFDHALTACSPGVDRCVSIAEKATPQLLNASGTTILAVVSGGVFLGLFGCALVDSRLAARRTLFRRLRDAIRRDQIEVVYQPLVRLSGRSVVGYEALARWRHSNGEEIVPDEFIPLAERTGLLPALTRRVVDRTLADMAATLKGGDLYVSINLGVEPLLSADFREHLAAACEANGIARRHVALEITERETGEMSRIGDAITKLREDGFRVFLDDFGTGYSSLAYLTTLPIDTIKLDKLFTRSVGTSLVATLVLKQICAMVETLDLTIVFEGVETEEQARGLEEIAPGAVGQGWLFGRPVPPAPGRTA